MRFTLNIEQIEISKLVAYENNPKVHPDHQIKQLEKSLKEFGWTTPVLIDDNNVVVAGHGRLEAAMRSNIKSAPCVRLSSLNDHQIKAYRIADNRLSEMGRWDKFILADEFSGLMSSDFNVEATGFSDGFVKSVLDGGSDFEVPEIEREADYTPKIGSTEVSADQMQRTSESEHTKAEREAMAEKEREETIICPHCGQGFEVLI